MLVNDASNPGTYTYTILDDNYNDFPYGSASFYNFTEENDVVGLDASAHTIRPGEHFVDKRNPARTGKVSVWQQFCAKASRTEPSFSMIVGPIVRIIAGSC